MYSNRLFELTDDEKERLRQGVQAALVIPFIDGIKDFVWEAIFSFTKGLPIPGTLQAGYPVTVWWEMSNFAKPDNDNILNRNDSV